MLLPALDEGCDVGDLTGTDTAVVLPGDAVVDGEGAELDGDEVGDFVSVGPPSFVVTDRDPTDHSLPFRFTQDGQQVSEGVGDVRRWRFVPRRGG
jgi:hypothetical protein